MHKKLFEDMGGMLMLSYLPSFPPYHTVWERGMGREVAQLAPQHLQKVSCVTITTFTWLVFLLMVCEVQHNIMRCNKYWPPRTRDSMKMTTFVCFSFSIFTFWFGQLYMRQHAVCVCTVQKRSVALHTITLFYYF